MCRTDSSFLGLLGLGASASIHARQFRCFTLIESSPVPHGRRIREAWTKSDLCVHIFHLYAIKRQLGAFFASHIYTLYQILRHQLQSLFHQRPESFIAILISLILSITYNLNTITWKEFIQTHLTRLSPLISFNIAKTHNFFCHFL